MNRVNVFRVDNPSYPLYIQPVGIGPYYYFRSVKKEKNDEWGTHCVKYEPCENTYKKFGVSPFGRKMIPTLPKEKRPGPFEDLELRAKILSYMGAITKDGKQFHFCFDSIAQFKGWFDDPEELKFLEDNNFVLSQYLVDAKSFISGSKQAVFFTEGFQQVKARLGLTTATPIDYTHTP